MLGAVYVAAIVCNGLLNAMNRERPGVPSISSPLGLLSFGLFGATLYFAYRYIGWIGVVIAPVALIIGIAAIAIPLRSRVPALPPR